MKPCSRHRKQLALLAVDALEAAEAQELRTHAQSCEPCRQYLAELSALTQNLSAVEINADLQTGEAFHQRVVSKLRLERSESIWKIDLARLSESLPSWRIALPATAAVLCLGILALLWRPAARPTGPAVLPIATSAPAARPDLPPTLANYQMVASQSLEKFDELLSKQGNKNPSSSRTYLASGTEE